MADKPYIIGIDNVEVNIDRVAQRVAEGGHNVPIEDIRRRYFPLSGKPTNRITISG